tara:strand:+ start:1653 stop:1886 length:234 start_codon:yes stop_codon:yes gene_type:complete
MLLRGKATATAKSPGGLLSRQATLNTTPSIQKEPLETIKDLDNQFLAKVRSKAKFTNKEVATFIKEKIEAINELDDF